MVFSIGTAARSSVLRMLGSKVRMPRSHSTTLGLPSAMMYSALITSSSSVLASPRLSSTGVCRRPTAFSSSKFCMLRAPIWIISTPRSKNSGMCSLFISSVTTGWPVASRALASRSSPSARSPWKLYGLVRGLNAPPRSSEAPAACTRRATSVICSSLSTLHGPAITAKYPPPILCPPTSTMVSSGWNLRLAFLYGSDTRRQVLTTGFASTQLSLKDLVSPIRPRMCVSLPIESLIVKPMPRSSRQNASTAAGAAWSFKTMIIKQVLRCCCLHTD